MLPLIPLSLYVHIPWCIKKCPYCDFNSYSTNEFIPEDEYVKHLLSDLDNNLLLINKRKISTIFIGGGTPNLLSSNSIERLMYGILNRLTIKKDAEISIEINPEKILDIKQLNIYKKIGINRISIGIQSFYKENLNCIGRIHSPEESQNIINFINNLGINNINLDLMYGLPNQSVNNALNDLRKAISFNPKHISWYQLTIEPNTLFYKKKPNLPNDNIIWHIFKQGHNLLLSSGYKQYEISSYAKSSKFFCSHNINYWRFGDYLGIGCGAHSKLTKLNYDTIRMVKTRHPKIFMQGKYLNKSFIINSNDKQLEFFMNRFRLKENIKKSEFTFYTGLSDQVIRKKIFKLVKNKYIIENNKEWKITKKGYLFLNNLLEFFL